MQYTSLSENQYYNQCAPLVDNLGFVLVELVVNQRREDWQIRLVISKRAANTLDEGSVGIDDCSKVHRLVLPRFEAILQNQDIYMEVTSPGLERLIKNAAEFELFVNRGVKVWCSDISDWLYGVIESADTTSVTIRRNDNKTAVTIPYTVITKAKLDYSREVEK